MFNNLGLYGGAGFIGTAIPIIRRTSVTRVLPMVARRTAPSAIANFGGYGNDTINIGGGAGTIGPQGPQGIPGPAGPTGTPGLVPVTQVTSSTFTASASDYFLCVDVASPVTITLPTGILGTVYIVKDCDGDAATNPITIQGTGGQLIDGSVSTINTNYGSLNFIFNGTDWSIA